MILQVGRDLQRFQELPGGSLESSVKKRDVLRSKFLSLDAATKTKLCTRSLDPPDHLRPQ